MNKFYKCSIIILMIVLIFVQIFCINKLDKDNNISVSNVQSHKYKYKTLKDINDELTSLKEKTILSATKTDEKWHVKLKLSGSKTELLNEISKLNNYDINSYEIDKNEKENSIILEISDKERV